MAKADYTKVHPTAAREALQRAGNDTKKAYSEYVRLMFRSTGSLAPGCDNRDLQAFYDRG